METKTKEQVSDGQVPNGNDEILYRLSKLESENSDLKKEIHSVKNKKVGSSKKNRTLERPTYKADELSKRMPNDKFFNKVSHHNQGDEKNPVGVTSHVDYFHATFGQKKHTCWKG